SSSQRDPGARRTGAIPDGADQYGARANQVLRGAVAGLQSAQPESGEEPGAEPGVAKCPGTIAGGHRIAQRADLRIQPADREDCQGKLTAGSAAGTGEGSGDADRAHLPADAGRSASFSQEPRRGLLCRIAAGA